MDQNIEGGLNDLLYEAMERNTEFVTQKTELVRHANDVLNQYGGELYQCFERFKHVRECEGVLARTLTGCLPPLPLQEAIPPPEDKRGRFAELADMLTRRE